MPADIIPANERPDAEFPFVLITGRQLEHWHTGSMTRRASVLDALEPLATASMNGLDLAEMGLQPGDVVTLRSRRGEVALHLRRDDGTPRGAVPKASSRGTTSTSLKRQASQGFGFASRSITTATRSAGRAVGGT